MHSPFLDSRHLVQKSVCFPNVSEFVWIYLQFHVTWLLLQAGSCIMHQIHSLHCFMECNFPSQYKSDCNNDIFNKKLDTLLLPHFSFSFPSPMILTTSSWCLKWNYSNHCWISEKLCMPRVLSRPWRMKMFCKELMPANTAELWVTKEAEHSPEG